MTEAEEFQKIYNLDVVAIPTHKPVVRVGLSRPDLSRRRPAKFKAVVDEIAEMHKKGQPVLVGTVSVETSEMLSDMLNAQGRAAQRVECQAAREGSRRHRPGGRSGTVTIATNMAGRGVDILLGGNAEGMARESLRNEGIDLAALPKDDPVWLEALEEAKAEVEADRQKVLAAGRAARARHRTARGAAHRQPVAWSCGAPGRSRVPPASSSRWKTN